MKKLFGFTAMAVLILQNLSLAQSFLSSPQAYFGKKPPGDTPVVFAGGRLADSSFWAGSRVGFSEDGKVFLYGRNTMWFDGTLYISSPDTKKVCAWLRAGSKSRINNIFIVISD